MTMAEQLPGKGLWGWLGRQWGYMTKAVKKDVAKTVVHREERVEEAELPDRPDVILRRTVIDEVIVDKKSKAPSQEPPRGQPPRP
jgi:hypothetical protein